MRINSRLVTTATALRQRSKLALLVVTAKALTMRQRQRLERSLLQPERVTVILWRLDNEFLIRITLRLISLVAGRAIISAAVLVFVMRESDSEIRNKFFSPCRRPKRSAQTGKRKARRITRTCFDVAIRTDPRRGSFAREELPAMAVDTRLVIGKLSNIGKGILFADDIPVLRRKFVTGLAFEPVVLVEVREPGIINTRFCDRVESRKETQQAQVAL